MKKHFRIGMMFLSFCLLVSCASSNESISLKQITAVELTNGMTGEKIMISNEQVLNNLKDVLNGAIIKGDRSEDSAGYTLAIRIKGTTGLTLLNYDHVQYQGKKHLFEDAQVVNRLKENLKDYVQ